MRRNFGKRFFSDGADGAAKKAIQEPLGRPFYKVAYENASYVVATAIVFSWASKMDSETIIFPGFVVATFFIITAPYSAPAIYFTREVNMFKSGTKNTNKKETEKFCWASFFVPLIGSDTSPRGLEPNQRIWGFHGGERFDAL